MCWPAKTDCQHVNLLARALAAGPGPHFSIVADEYRATCAIPANRDTEYTEQLDAQMQNHSCEHRQ